VRDYSNGWPVTSFKPPKGLVKATIDAWSGGKPGPWTKARTTAWFIAGTQPDAKNAIDPDGLLYSQACGGYRVDLVKAELGPSSWDSADADWMRRARSGPGRISQWGTRTAYFWKQSSWGGQIAGSCSASRPTHGGGNQAPKHKGKHGGGGGLPLPTPAPAPTTSPAPQ